MTRLLNSIQHNWVAITFLLLVLITLLSLWPLQELPPVPGTDKIHHLLAYAALMFPAALRKPANWLWLAVGFIAYSGAIELIQPYVNRYGEWADMLANTTGILCGLVLAEALRYCFRTNLNQPDNFV